MQVVAMQRSDAESISSSAAHADLHELRKEVVLTCESAVMPLWAASEDRILCHACGAVELLQHHDMHESGSTGVGFAKSAGLV